jgi:hypothetical protein
MGQANGYIFEIGRLDSRPVVAFFSFVRFRCELLLLVTPASDVHDRILLKNWIAIHVRDPDRIIPPLVDPSEIAEFDE